MATDCWETVTLSYSVVRIGLTKYLGGVFNTLAFSYGWAMFIVKFIAVFLILLVGRLLGCV